MLLPSAIRKVLHFSLTHQVLPLLLLNLVSLAYSCYFFICERHEIASAGIGIPAGKNGLKPEMKRKGRHPVSSFARCYGVAEAEL